LAAVLGAELVAASSLWDNRDLPFLPERELRLPLGESCVPHDERLRTFLPRRTFLGLGATAAAGALLPSQSQAATAMRAPERVLSFFHTHTGERLKVAYCCGGEYQPGGLAEVNHILRDFRVNESRAIEPGLLDLLHELGGTLHIDQPFHVISGYRSPQTNQMLRERGGAGTGVASHSLHMVGQAIDIRIPGVKLGTLRDAARTLKIGGVGFYPDLDFVHVDVGRVRYW
jgi:uncharacterized protein YcbK (DUF882 family)